MTSLAKHFDRRMTALPCCSLSAKASITSPGEFAPERFHSSSGVLGAKPTAAVGMFFRENNGRPSRRPRSGIVLILVTVFIVMLTLAGLNFVMTLATEHKAIKLRGDEIRLQHIMESGVEWMGVLAEQSVTIRKNAGGTHDNPDLFRGISVPSDEAAGYRGRVTLVSPRFDEDELIGVRYGWENESGRLNLGVLPEWEKRSPGAGQLALMKLPGMTETAAAKIMDWIDADDTARVGGGERQQYSDLHLPYAPRNGCPARIEELLLIRDVSRQSLLGSDLNCDYRLSAHETGDRSERIGSNSTGTPPPWSMFLTLYSAERNDNPRGRARINLNDPNLSQLYSNLTAVMSTSWAEFIILYRQLGPAGNLPGGPMTPPNGPPPGGGMPGGGSPGGGASAGGAPAGGLPAGAGASPLGSDFPPAGSGGAMPPPGGPQSASGTGATGSRTSTTLDFSRPGRFRIESVLDLVGARVMLMPPQGQRPQAQPPQFVESPFTTDVTAMRTYLPKLLDETTVVSDTIIRGRININVASRTVLRAVPGMEERFVEAIVSGRNATEEDADRRYPIWLLTEGQVNLAQMKALLPYLTCGGRVYRAQVIGYLEEGGSTARAEVVVDAAVTPPKPVSWTDLRVRGRGFSREEL